MRADPLLLLPDFALIALGYLLCRHTALDRKVWNGAEQLVYYLLFPALLFQAIARSPIDPGPAAGFGLAGLSIVGLGVLMALACGRWPGVDRLLHASGAQCAFRFNSFVGLALCERLAGSAGLAWMALLIALCVPVCNVAAVWPLARAGGQGLLRELARNPLIVSTVAGLAFNLSGLRLPELATTTLSRIGAAALPLGLMAVGAGLQMGALREAPRLAGALLAIRHALLPLWALALGTLAAAVLGPWGRLDAQQQLVLVIFGALPTASSAYVLAARMGGNGAYAAGLVTLSTLLAMPGLPIALALHGVISGA
ncbi:AEC family transporter [Pseudaquabacterium rugosum]|uniref:AEC family transporter n=1 Tax=Pseudaquabacterium rugosum TaxID=2984194 RepID=A0ABU9B8V5_9BURK